MEGRSGDQFGIILKSLVLQKGRDRLRCLCSPSCSLDSEEAVNICRRSESSRPCCPTLISLPPQPGRTAASVQTERLGAQARFVNVCTVVQVQLKLNRQTLQAPIHLNKVPTAPSAAKSAALASCAMASPAIASPASAGTWVITYCLHNSAGGPAGRRPAIRSCRCPRSLSGSRAGGPCRRGPQCHWPCRQTGGGGKNEINKEQN